MALTNHPCPAVWVVDAKFTIRIPEWMANFTHRNSTCNNRLAVGMKVVHVQVKHPVLSARVQRTPSQRDHDLRRLSTMQPGKARISPFVLQRLTAQLEAEPLVKLNRTFHAPNVQQRDNSLYSARVAHINGGARRAHGFGHHSTSTVPLCDGDPASYVSRKTSHTPALGRATAIVRNRRDIPDGADFDTRSRQCTDCRFTA